MSPDEMKRMDSIPKWKFYLLHNWLSLAGLVVAVGSVFAFVLLLAFDVMGTGGNPYLGILAYLVAPMFLFLGVGLIVLGVLLSFRRAQKKILSPFLQVDFSLPKTLRHMTIFIAVSLVFLLFVAIASYRSYHFSESPNFCGQSCHTPMTPEFTAYLQSPHARVACVECHIGSGATWYLKAKVNGLHQVHATLLNKFDRPIKTPIKNMRPAQETCEHCHWPERYIGDVDKVYPHYLSNTNNTPFAVRLRLNVGGADPTHGPVGGIHWHMNVGNKTEYIARDPMRQDIPWVRVTTPNGKVTEYRVKGFKDDPSKHAIRTMDCMDCHNRPAHVFRSPNDVVDTFMHLGKLDASMPLLKQTVLEVLTKPYKGSAEAADGIHKALSAKYPGDSRLQSTIRVVQGIYRDNFFPEMKTDWKVHPNNLGHKDWPGCFRCHDGEHMAADGKQTIKASDCKACHLILAQGNGAPLDQIDLKGQEFRHPGDEIGDMKCNECHNGGPQ